MTDETKPVIDAMIISLDRDNERLAVARRTLEEKAKDSDNPETYRKAALKLEAARRAIAEATYTLGLVN